MEKATSSWGQSVVGLALVRALWPAEGGAGVSLGFGGPRFVPRSGGEQGWEAQAGPRRKRSEAEVLEGGGRWQPLSQKGSSWEGAVLERARCLQAYGRARSF